MNTEIPVPQDPSIAAEVQRHFPAGDFPESIRQRAYKMIERNHAPAAQPAKVCRELTAQNESLRAQLAAAQSDAAGYKAAAEANAILLEQRQGYIAKRSAQSSPTTREGEERLRGKRFSFSVDFAGEKEAGLHPFNDVIHIIVESGDTGGVEIEFVEQMQQHLTEWNDMATVTYLGSAQLATPPPAEDKK